MTATASTLRVSRGFVPPAERPARRPSRHLVPPRLLAVLAATAVLWITMTAVQADQPVAVEAYVVSAGDTLWTIAGDVTPNGSDVRQTIATIRELNDLSGSMIHPGQTLMLPAGP